MFLAYLTNLHGCCRHILIYRNAFYKETTELQRQDGKWTATPDKRRPSFSLVRVASGGQAPSLVPGEHSRIPGRRRQGCHRRSSRHCVLSFISSSKGTRMWENRKIMLDPDVEETKRKRGKWHSSTAAAARTLQVDTEEIRSLSQRPASCLGLLTVSNVAQDHSCRPTSLHFQQELKGQHAKVQARQSLYVFPLQAYTSMPEEVTPYFSVACNSVSITWRKFFF